MDGVHTLRASWWLAVGIGDGGGDEGENGTVK